MAGVKMTLVLDEKLAHKLRAAVPARHRSRFIAEALRKELTRVADLELARAHEEAHAESAAQASELDGVTGDGID